MWEFRTGTKFGRGLEEFGISLASELDTPSYEIMYVNWHGGVQLDKGEESKVRYSIQVDVKCIPY